MISTSVPNPTSSQSIQFKTKQSESKKNMLRELETTLKKRISELKELCLKEADITGHLPIDYPLQQREPIPQIRCRTSHYNNCNLNNNYCFSPIDTIIPRQQSKEYEQLNRKTLSNVTANNIQFQTRPTSTNSINSSISTVSSNTKSNQHQYFTRDNDLLMRNPLAIRPSYLNQSSFDNGNSYAYSNLEYNNQYSLCPTNHSMRAGSIVSFSSSSCSGTSSSLSNSTVPNQEPSQTLLLNSQLQRPEGDRSPPSKNMLNRGQQRILSRLFENGVNISARLSTRSHPLRGLDSRYNEQYQALKIENQDVGNYAKTETSDEADLFQNFNIGGIEKFLPYYEETKPFQMSDFYKYSSKHLKKNNDSPGDGDGAIKKLQESSTKIISYKCTPSDQDRIQSSVRLVEKDSHKLIDTAAKAITSEPLICR